MRSRLRETYTISTNARQKIQVKRSQISYYIYDFIIIKEDIIYLANYNNCCLFWFLDIYTWKVKMI